MIDLAGADATVIAFSDLGMGVNDTGEHLLDDVLRRLEWADASPLGRAWGRLRRNVADASPSQRRAYQVEHNEISGAIRVNLKGRESHGTVERGRGLDALYTSLTRDLLELVDPGSGQPIVERVIRVDTEFPGAQRDRLPDLLVVWQRNAPITGASSPKIGELRLRSPFRPGNHVPDGWFVCAGPTIVSRGESAPASIMDLGPTIATLLGAEPLEADGTPIAAVVPPPPPPT